MNQSFSKKKLLDQLREALSGEQAALGAWLGGSRATVYEDELSDMDLVVISSEPELIFNLIEKAISKYWSIEMTFKVEGPTLFMHFHQRFYTLKGSPETYYIDAGIFTGLNPENYREFFNQERHGRPVVLFDKQGILQAASEAPLIEAPRFNKENHRSQFEIIYRTFLKESLRNKYVDSHLFYQRLILLFTQAQRILYSPQKHDFSLRYLYYDLPRDSAKFIEEMLKVTDLKGMQNNAKLIKEKLYKSYEEII